MSNRSVVKLNSFSNLQVCPICRETRHQYLFVIHGLPIARCIGCDLISVFPFPCLHDYPSFDATRQDPALLWTDSVTEEEAASGYIVRLKNMGLTETSQILLISPPGHAFARVASEQGHFHIKQMSVRQMEEDLKTADEFDAAVILFQLEKSCEPMKFLGGVRNILKKEGLLFLAVPSLDSFSARLFGQQWTEWRPENCYYYSRKTIQLLLWHAGFNQVKIEKDKRRYTLDHIYDRAKAFPKTSVTRAVRLGYHILPRPFHHLRMRLPTSAITVTARRGEASELPTCSIILPVYNEAATFSTLINGLMNKQMEGLNKEIIIVESNSTDGTREEVLKFTDCKDVKVILQERARGKGNAVREGFSKATGEIILIQDADLEYDLNDYEGLLAPLINYQVPFVLGSRHGGRWKMREFTDQRGFSEMLNFGHVFFTSLINILYGQHMKDPFTMYKVFRRDCLWGLEFESNRFDFDFELVIKLVRKGYTPLEIPVNYHSRSFKEGKKVRLFRDPLTWLWVNFKFRFVPLFKDDHVQGEHIR